MTPATHICPNPLSDHTYCGISWDYSTPSGKRPTLAAGPLATCDDCQASRRRRSERHLRDRRSELDRRLSRRRLPLPKGLARRPSGRKPSASLRKRLKPLRFQYAQNPSAGFAPIREETECD